MIHTCCSILNLTHLCTFGLFFFVLFIVYILPVSYTFVPGNIFNKLLNIYLNSRRIVMQIFLLLNWLPCKFNTLCILGVFSFLSLRKYYTKYFIRIYGFCNPLLNTQCSRRVTFFQLKEFLEIKLERYRKLLFYDQKVLEQGNHRS